MLTTQKSFLDVCLYISNNKHKWNLLLKVRFTSTCNELLNLLLLLLNHTLASPAGGLGYPASLQWASLSHCEWCVAVSYRHRGNMSEENAQLQGTRLLSCVQFCHHPTIKIILVHFLCLSEKILEEVLRRLGCVLSISCSMAYRGGFCRRPLWTRAFLLQQWFYTAFAHF